MRVLHFVREPDIFRPFLQLGHDVVGRLEFVEMQSSTIDRRLRLAEYRRQNTCRVRENVFNIPVLGLLASDIGRCISHSNQYFLQRS